MNKLRPVRGTHDLLPEDARRARHVVDTGRRVAERYCYEEMATPVFEFAEVFSRTLGQTSDIVTKEMYTFEDRGGDLITLRPEGTAGVARALISGGLSANLPLRYFYAGPMFRYERPQKGRLRQFHQIGIELLGIPDPTADIEVIAVGAAVLNDLNLGESAQLELNSLGNTESRSIYRRVLVEYLRDHIGDLSEESRERLERNPLRILDSKNSGDREIIANAPMLSDSLDTESRDFFEAVCAGLETLGIAYRYNPRLVRGLDYYCHTAFEFVTDRLGAQGAVLAGGRYDGLVKMMGGPATPGIGWASGVERLSLLVDHEPQVPRPIVVIPIDPSDDPAALQIAEELRLGGMRVTTDHRGRLKQRMRRANAASARAVILIGEDERSLGSVKVRDLDSGQEELKLQTELIHFLQQLS